MRIVIWLLALVACAGEETSLSETAQNITKQEIIDAYPGNYCTVGPSAGYSFCFDCLPSRNDKGEDIKICAVWLCPDDGGECTYHNYFTTDCTLGQDTNFWFEAESGRRSGPLGGLQHTANASASAGKMLEIVGGGTTTFDDFYVNVVPVQLRPWVRVIAPSTSSNSFYLQVDNVAKRFEVPVSTTWTWVRLDELYNKAAGWHSLRIHADEPGLKIDRILLTGSPIFTPVVHAVQAEAYGWVPPMTSGIMKALPPALPTTYIWVPNGAGTGGYAQLEVDVPRADNYVVWGRFNAPTTADNSIYIAESLQDRVAWDVPTTSAGGWAWDRADASGERLVLTLAPGDLIEVAQREDGTRLDKLVFTNDPGFTLVE